ncbi:MAG: hypothetical protein COT73_00215 [Bdellovibrio sp. CG10_big_fil_rev_8_21_14_0_10_47_8]|nr:MAG: hypothetical protein COT73_00215 [Bdellovibrio sp. CG10_big_fil_rev_8_21_14_0_10_47_8]
MKTYHKIKVYIEPCWKHVRSMWKSPHFQKWGLFCLLAVALGSTLSMNPEHFNNIARYEIKNSLYTLDLAATNAEDQIADIGNIADSVKTPGILAKANRAEKSDSKKDDSEKTLEINVAGKKGTFKAKVFEVEGSLFVKMESSSCDCFPKPVGLSEKNIKNVDDISKELMALVNEDSKSDDKVADEKDEDKTQEFDLEKWAASCETKVYDSLTCHKSRLIKLSQTLKNDKKGDQIVLDYFETYLKEELRRALTNPTIKVSRTSRYELMTMRGAYQGFEEDTDALEKAEDITTALIKGLSGKNGKSTIESLINLQAVGQSAQLRNAQNLAIRGKKENRMDLFQAGLQRMDPMTAQLELDRLNDNMDSAINGMSRSRSTSSDRDAFLSYLDKSFYTPVSDMYSNLRSFVASGDPRNPQASHTFLDFNGYLTGDISSPYRRFSPLTMDAYGRNTRGFDLPWNVPDYSTNAQTPVWGAATRAYSAPSYQAPGASPFTSPSAGNRGRW